jgi:hypothetical protein
MTGLARARGAASTSFAAASTPIFAPPFNAMEWQGFFFRAPAFERARAREARLEASCAQPSTQRPRSRFGKAAAAAALAFAMFPAECRCQESRPEKNDARHAPPRQAAPVRSVAYFASAER